MTGRIAGVQDALRQAGLDGWLFYDFRLSDPIAYRVLELSERGATTRRWFCFVPSRGPVRTIVSAVEAHRLDALGGEPIVYRSYAEMVAGLRSILVPAHRIAMNYSPKAAIPYVSRVDAGTLELVRSTGVEVVSSADLVQWFEARLTAAQLAGHRRAGAALGHIVDETFAEIARWVRGGGAPTEYEIQQFVMSRIAARGLTTAEPPIVAVNEHSADPHFGPTPDKAGRIRPGDFVLLDLWAKEPGPDAAYADITWTGFVGEAVPVEHARVFEIVARARDAAVDLVKRRVDDGATIRGHEADRAARTVIEQAGYGEAFVHRTGHSIGREVHGMGANLDSLETQDHRALIEATCFSVEPGIYLPGRFGVRSELDMTIENGRAAVSAPEPQREIVPILARYRP
jgi:Xaa-Pro aminopeptidase